jgi:hypothetical protein
MLGWPDAAWHLELVGDPEGETPPTPSEEDLLVLYVGGPLDAEAVDPTPDRALGRSLVLTVLRRLWS